MTAAGDDAGPQREGVNREGVKPPPPPLGGRRAAAPGTGVCEAAPGAALFLDVDGTLLNLCDDPAAVRADAGLLDLLDRLSARLGGALALVSGRDLASVDRIFAPRRYVAAGTHGAEIRLPDGEVRRFQGDAFSPGPVSLGPCSGDRSPAGRLADAVDAIDEQRRAGGWGDALRLERKTLSAALHYRGFPHLRGEAERLAHAALAALGDGFRLKPGKDVVEIAPAAADKGRAAATLAAHPPFAGRRPFFIGDDATDEQGFAFVNDAGGTSIRIGPPDAPTLARYVLPDPAALRRWLAEATTNPVDPT